jgi:hypothetical protein
MAASYITAQFLPDQQSKANFFGDMTEIPPPLPRTLGDYLGSRGKDNPGDPFLHGASLSLFSAQHPVGRCNSPFPPKPLDPGKPEHQVLLAFF